MVEEHSMKIENKPNQYSSSTLCNYEMDKSNITMSPNNSSTITTAVSKKSEIVTVADDLRHIDSYTKPLNRYHSSKKHHNHYHHHQHQKAYHQQHPSDDESRNNNGSSSVNGDDKGESLSTLSSTSASAVSGARESGGSNKNCSLNSKNTPIVPCPAEFDNLTLIRHLQFDNQRLENEICRLKRLIVSSASVPQLSELTGEEARVDPVEKSNTAITTTTDQDVNNGNSCNNNSESNVTNSNKNSVERELDLAREAIAVLKCDKRKLKTEKHDLICQLKLLYTSYEEQEKELREFIRNFQQRTNNSESSYQQLSNEREERERERWSLLRHARDEAERSLSLAAQLNAKDIQLQQLQDQLNEAKRLLTANSCIAEPPISGGLLAAHRVGSCSADSGVRLNSDRDSGGATSIGGNLSDSTIDVIGNCGLNIKERSPNNSPLSSKLFSHSIDSGVLSRSVEQLNSPMDPEPINFTKKLKHLQHSRPVGGIRGGTWGSISRVFARTKNRNKSAFLNENNSLDSMRNWSPLTEEGYLEKLKLLREASTIPMEMWKAPTVLAWIEIALGMPQYGTKCTENIKSGKIRGLNGQVLLELNDLELECGLGIGHPMHRKKLRLAIEEHRNPIAIRYPCIGQLGHTWVSSEWLPDLGLAQYSDNFASNMVDARMLEHLSKKELEKYLCVTRKFHQASIVHGIHLLRIIKYDRQSLAMRRHQCENMDVDPLVWTNQRFVRWARSIDLVEYADNLKDSGVHGALVVLETSFNGDTMATALGIPASKNIIRRHLTAELESLILPARSSLEHYIRMRQNNNKHRVPGGSLGRSFSRSCAGNLSMPANDSNEPRRSFRDSLSRAFGLKSKSDHEKQSPTSSSENSVISRISFQSHQLQKQLQQQQQQQQLQPQHKQKTYLQPPFRYNSYHHHNSRTSSTNSTNSSGLANNGHLNYKNNNSLYSEIGSPVYATPLVARQLMKNSISETEDYEVPFDMQHRNSHSSSSYAYDNDYFDDGVGDIIDDGVDDNEDEVGNGNSNGNRKSCLSDRDFRKSAIRNRLIDSNFDCESFRLNDDDTEDDENEHGNDNYGDERDNDNNAEFHNTHSKRNRKYVRRRVKSISDIDSIPINNHLMK